MSDQLFCTIITRNYVAYAKALAASLAKYCPRQRLLVLIVDATEKPVDPAFDTVSLDELPHQDVIRKMTFYYRANELCCALRPFLHEYLFENTKVKQWIQIDSDVVVYHSLDEIWNLLDSCSLLLSPHILQLGTDKASANVESALLKYGTFNGGFMGFRRTEITRQFLAWSQSRMKDFCFIDGPGSFGDQIWLNLVPSHFDEVAIVRHPGANVAFWNFHERTLTKDSTGNFLVDGKPLLFVHYSGWSPANPEKVTRYLTYYSPGRDWFWSELSKRYASDLAASELNATKNLPYGFGTFSNGAPISDDARRAYFEMLSSKEDSVEHPFEQSEYFLEKVKLRRRAQMLGRVRILPSKVLQTLKRGI